jgi:hypothetical protein
VGGARRFSRTPRAPSAAGFVALVFFLVGCPLPEKTVVCSERPEATALLGTGAFELCVARDTAAELSVLFYRSKPEYRDRPLEDMPIPGLDVTAPLGLQAGEGGSGGAGGGQGGASAGSELGLVTGQVFDCRGLLNYGAKGVVITVSDPDGGSPTVANYVRGNSVDFTLKATDLGGYFAIPYAKPGERRFTVTQDDRVIAETTMYVESGGQTILALFPNAKSN